MTDPPRKGKAKTNDLTDKEKEDAKAGEMKEEKPSPEAVLRATVGTSSEEHTENALLTAFEQRRGVATTPGGWTSAVEGEQPPLAGVPFGSLLGETQTQPKKRKPSLKDIAKRVAMLKKLETLRVRRTNQTTLPNIEEEIENEDTDVFDNVAAVDAPSDTERLLDGALAVERLFLDEEEPEEAPVETGGPTERLPLLRGSASPSVSRGQRISRTLARCNPFVIIRGFFRVLIRSFILPVGIPAVSVAFISYYFLGNPELDFLPGNGSLSWWLLFLARQILLLDLARLSQFLLIDCLILNTKFVVQAFGPLFTLFQIQAKGYPLIFTFWSVWDMIFLHGNNTFQQNWFYFLRMDIFSPVNKGGEIIATSQYLRVLLSLLLVGLATSMKRTMVAMHFGKKRFHEFKPRLEKLIREIVIVSEVGELARSAEDFQFEPETSSRLAKHSLWHTVVASGSGVEDSNSVSSVDSPGSPNRSGTFAHKTSGTEATGEDKRGRGGSAEGDAEASWEKLQEEKQEEEANRFFQGSMTKSMSTDSLRIKDLLYPWEEPSTSSQSEADVSISDILRFRRAIMFMDNKYPFSEAYGPASTRDDAITSSLSVYNRLLTLTPGTSALSFDVLAILAQDENGVENQATKKLLKRMFCPNVKNELTQLAFAQSCDTVYKKLRYFRAAVGNSSVIDNVLENGLNNIFFFGLAWLVLCLLHYNPWPLVVSMLSLLVSVAFALGPTVASFIQGVALIMSRRPYDLGDRIVIAPPNAPVKSSDDSWFVQDINLSTTTLRFAPTNEVATISNSSIAMMRIVNQQRSPEAIVDLVLKLHLAVLAGNNLSVFQAELSKYLRDRPRLWKGIEFLRVDAIDADLELVSLTLKVKHRFVWQNRSPIMNHLSNLRQFAHGLSEKMKIDYGNVPNRRIVYYGGDLVSAGVQDYKSNLLAPDNLKDASETLRTSISASAIHGILS